MSSSNVVPFSLASGTADVDPDTAGNEALKGELSFYGYSIRESATVAAVATVILRDGLDDTGKIVAVIELAANASTQAWHGPQGIRINKGLFVDRVAGETEGAVYLS